MATVAIFIHHMRDEAAEVARRLTTSLQTEGYEVRLPRADAAIVGRPELAFDAFLEEGLPAPDGLASASSDSEPPVRCEDIAVAVAIGGDGTMLRTVAAVAHLGTAVVGVNVGQLGYLTDVEPVDALAVVRTVLEGTPTIEERMLVGVQIHASTALGPLPAGALNEVVVEKTPSGHTVRLAVFLNGEFFTTYAADGLIVASPTGSTAYSFSARGPILDPGMRAMVLTPVSPHMLFDRSLVLPPDLEVRLEVLGHRPATVSVDGRNAGLLHEGDSIVCTGAAVNARLVNGQPRNFHHILKTKFGLADR